MKNQEQQDQEPIFAQDIEEPLTDYQKFFWN